MKQQDNVTAQRIEATQIRPLAQIAAVTGQCQILRLVGSSMLSGDNMFDVMGEFAVMLAQQTIFAAIAGSLPRNL